LVRVRRRLLNLIRESRRSAEDVFLVGDELPADDSDDAAAEGGFLVQGVVPKEPVERDALQPRPEVEERSLRHVGSKRWVGAMALGLGLIALTVLVLRPDGNGGVTSQPDQPTAAQRVDGQGGDERQQAVRPGEQRAQERKNTAKRDQAERKPRRGDSASDESAAVAGSAPAPTVTTAYTPPATTTSTPVAPSTGSGTDTATAGGGSGDSGSDDPAPCEFTFEC